MQKVVKETNYGAAFRENLAREENAWLKYLRENAFEFFTENGFPTVKNEEWKYTNVAPIEREIFEIADGREVDAEKISELFSKTESENRVVFVNNKLNQELTNLSNLPEGAKILNLNEAIRDEIFSPIVRKNLGKSVDAEANGFTALNTAFIEEGVFIFVPKETKIELPIHLIFITDENTASFPRVLLVAERGSEAMLIESYLRTAETKYLTDSVIEIVLEDDAKLKHLRVQRESHNAFHVGTTAVNLNRASVYDSTNITLGARLSRHDVLVKFNAEGAECFVDGLYMVAEEQHADTHSVIDHALPNCLSHQTYKGIVDGRARAVFNGKVFVRENATGTDAKQSNKNLLLSNDARVDTKPQLEIFNDDVKCAHGATVGQLEEEELFYLLSRGLNERLARNLLTYGFAEEIINKIEIESIKKQLDEAVLNRLNANLEI
ncbi:MAG TPA: Fe-S cluster assembly protein SufD [Pyrinomonadaceae bacterium]|nr:Fe-S cluster assembly protein SufD [Pyrinomonadaceae bacterium]